MATATAQRRLAIRRSGFRMGDDLIQRLRRHSVDLGVIAFARDALESGQTVETTVRRLRALGLCPPAFFDEDIWQDVAPTDVSPAPRPPPLRPLNLQLGWGVFASIMLAGWIIDYSHGKGWMAWAGAALLIPLFWQACRILWRVSLDLLQAWWRGGWRTDLVMAACLVAVVGCVWPQTGIWDSAVSRPAPQISEAPRPVSVVLNPQHPEADYEALPSGTRFIGPDGLLRQKP
jgi:hypothetical protein